MWRASALFWVLWGIALTLWFGMSRGEVPEAWTTMVVLWVLNGGILWLASRGDR